MESHYKIANELCNIDGVNDVQASEVQLVIVFAPSEQGMEQLPEKMAAEIETVIEGTDWIPEYEDVRKVEVHEWGHGRGNPILSSSQQEANYELQSKLVKSRL